MINTFKIDNSRGIKNLEINNLNKINIFVGDNGIGKTTILDALYVKLNPKFPTNECYLNHSTFLNNNFIASVLKNFIDRNKKEDLIKLLKKFKNSIFDITLDKNKEIKVKDAEFSNMIDAHTYGNGFLRALHIMCTLMANDSEVVLIDEIENGLHIFSQQYVWESILDLFESQNNTQLFANTHSYDMIKILMYVLKIQKKENFISVYRLQKDQENQLKLVYYNFEALQYALENNQEIR